MGEYDRLVEVSVNVSVPIPKKKCVEEELERKGKEGTVSVATPRRANIETITIRMVIGLTLSFTMMNRRLNVNVSAEKRL